MDGKCAPQMAQVSFYALYREFYAPQLMELDVLLKSMDQPLSVPEAADALGMDETDLHRAMEREAVTKLDKVGFLAVMLYGDGVCRLLLRELTRGAKLAYTAEDIAYIYGLQERTVQSVFDRLGIKEAPAKEVPALLEQIPVFFFKATSING